MTPGSNPQHLTPHFRVNEDGTIEQLVEMTTADPIERAAQAVIEDLSLVWSDDEAPTIADARDLARAALATIDRDGLARVLGDANDAWNRPDGTDDDDMRDLDDYQADAVLAWLRGEPRD